MHQASAAESEQSEPGTGPTSQLTALGREVKWIFTHYMNVLLKPVSAAFSVPLTQVLGTI